MWNKQLEIYLYIVTEKKWMTILVKETMNFKLILEQLNLRDMYVYEYISNQMCDEDLSLQALKVRNGMIFMIY